MNQIFATMTLKGLLAHIGQARCERRVLKAMERVEGSDCLADRNAASQQLSSLLTRDPQALKIFLDHQQIEEQLQELWSNPTISAS